MGSCAINFCLVKNDAGNEWNSNIPSQFSSLQEKATESISHLKELDILKKGTGIYDVKNLLSSQRKSISESFRLLKKDFSESYKGKHGFLEYCVSMSFCVTYPRFLVLLNWFSVIKLLVKMKLSY